MPEPRTLHRGSTLVMSVLMVLVGVAMLVATLAQGGGLLTVGFLLGVLFIAAGSGRLYVLRRIKAGRS
jgi:hypothetical protein